MPPLVKRYISVMIRIYLVEEVFELGFGYVNTCSVHRFLKLAPVDTAIVVAVDGVVNVP